MLINLDNSLSSSTSPSLSRCENSTSTNSDKTNYLSNYNNNNNNETNDYVNSSLNNNNAPISYESKIKHFVESYSSNENTTNNNQQCESKFTLVNFHQPTSKFSNSSSTLSYLNEIEIPSRLKRSSSFRSHPRKQQIIAQHQISKPEIVVNDTQVATKQAVVLTDSGFMSSFNSLSSSNSSSSSPPLLISGSKQINSTSPSSSSSSSPSTLNKLITTTTTADHDRLKNTTVKSIAKTYENNNTVILPNYFKPKLINTEKSNSIIKIINNNNDNSRLIRTKFESFEMPDTNNITTTTIKDDHDSTIKENEIDSMINLNVNEINLNNNNNNATDQQEYTKMNGYIISRIQNETTPQSCSTSPCSSPSLTMLTKQKLVKLNLGKSITYENDTDNKKQQTAVSNSQVGNSLHKVLNKIVETGIQVTNRASSLTPNTSFSKPPISMSKIKQTINNNNNNNNNTYSFEPINGYEDKTNNENNNESKLKKKLLYPYKSNSLTRQSKSSNENNTKSLFKLNEFESININKLSSSPTEQQQQQQLDTTTATKKIDKTYNFFNNFNSSPTNRQKNTEKLVSNLKSGKNKSYSISSSLPSRNLGNKVVDDIKSLFDKFTNSSGKNSHSSKLKTNDTNDSENSTFYTNNANDSPINNSSNSHDNIKLTTFKTENTSNSRLKLSQSFSANINSNNKLKSEIPNPDFQTVKSLLKEAKLDMNECPDSPRKGALKKLGVSSRDSSATRSPLKVRWKDMIEISDLIEDGSNDSEQENYTSDDSLNCQSDDVKIRNQSSDTENYHSIDSVLNNNINNKNKTKIKKKKLKKKSSKSTSDSFDIIVTSEKKSYLPSRKFEGKQQQFNLKPLHSTGKQFEKEMNERLEKLNQIKIKTNVESTTNEKFYDEIHSDLDVVLFELHSTIEHVRLSSMISNLNSSQEKNEENDNDLKPLDSNLKNEEKISNVAQICRHFVNNSKNMISSALVNESEVKPFVRNAMNSLCSLVVQCLETNYEYLNKNKKLDETRQLLIQILNLLNTFRTTLNITYLASSKQLNEGNMNLLMKQATNLANEISLLIKHFKLLF